MSKELRKYLATFNLQDCANTLESNGLGTVDALSVISEEDAKELMRHLGFTKQIQFIQFNTMCRLLRSTFANELCNDTFMPQTPLIKSEEDAYRVSAHIKSETDDDDDDDDEEEQEEENENEDEEEDEDDDNRDAEPHAQSNRNTHKRKASHHDNYDEPAESESGSESDSDGEHKKEQANDSELDSLSSLFQRIDDLDGVFIQSDGQRQHQHQDEECDHDEDDDLKQSVEADQHSKRKKHIWRKIAALEMEIKPQHLCTSRLRWKEWEEEYIKDTMQELHSAPDGTAKRITNWNEISCKLALFTKQKIANDESAPSAPWRTTRAVRDKWQTLTAKQRKKQTQKQSRQTENGKKRTTEASNANESAKQNRKRKRKRRRKEDMLLLNTEKAIKRQRTATNEYDQEYEEGVECQVPACCLYHEQEYADGELELNYGNESGHKCDCGAYDCYGAANMNGFPDFASLTPQQYAFLAHFYFRRPPHPNNFVVNDVHRRQCRHLK